MQLKLSEIVILYENKEALYNKNINNKRSEIYETLRMTIYLKFYSCCCFNKERYLKYKNLQNSFNSEINCEEILPKINYSYYAIRELIGK